MVKKNFLKRVTTMLLASVMTIGMLSTSALAADTTQAALPDPSMDGTSAITIHKFIMDDITHAGGSSDGNVVDPVDIPSGATSLNGVTFNISKLKNASGSLSSTDYDTSFGTDGSKTGKTKDNGTLNFGQLPFGTYKIEETGSVTGVSPAAPFLVTVPMTNPKGDGWIYDIHVYPKNEKLAIDKFVVEFDNKHHTATVGVNQEWIISSTVPSNMVVKNADNTTTASKKYTITDKLDEKLTYVGIGKVCAAGKNNEELTNGTLKETDDYTLIEPDKNGKGGTLKVALTKTGIEKVAALGAKKVHVHFTTKINENANASLGQPIPNGATLDYTNAQAQSSSVSVPDGTDPANPTDQRPEVHTGGVQIKKTDAAGTALAGAEFKIYASEADAKSGKNPITLINNANNGFTNTFTSGTDGLVKFKGLAYGGKTTEDYDTTTQTSYWIVETKAPEGFTLLDKPEEIIVSSTSHEDGAFVKPIVNKQNIKLPVTGGMGTILFTVSGLAFILLAVLLGLKAKSKVQQ